VPKHKAIYAHHVSKPLHHIKPSDSISTVVDATWLAQYHKLEATHGNYAIQDDQKIEAVANGKFRVPRTTLQHFDALNKTPPATPTP